MILVMKMPGSSPMCGLSVPPAMLKPNPELPCGHGRQSVTNGGLSMHKPNYKTLTHQLHWTTFGVEESLTADVRGKHDLLMRGLRSDYAHLCHVAAVLSKHDFTMR